MIMDITVTNTTTERKTVVILGRDHHIPLKPETIAEAWQVLEVCSRGQATFSYSSNTSVGAHYTREDGVQINIGPYPAKPGSTWTIHFASRDDSGSMTEESMFILS